MYGNRVDCTKCGKPAVAGCDGIVGRIPTDEENTTVRYCPNIYGAHLAAHLGREISRVPHVSASPLLKLNPKGGAPLVDLTQKNIILQSTWQSLLPHLKWTLGFKGLGFSFRIINDERIRNVYVGSEAYKSRTQSTRNDLETNNSLPDLVGHSQLLIIRLGFLGYKNAAAPGALKEVLMHRESACLPTWLVHDPHRPWDFSHNDDVAQYVDENFVTVPIKRLVNEPVAEAEPSLGFRIEEDEAEAPSEHNALVVEDEDLGPKYAPAPPPSPRAPVPHSGGTDGDLLGLDWANQGVKKSQKKWR